MAGALYKKEVVIRQNSTISLSAAQTWTQNWLASFQDDPDNIDSNGEYIDYFFGDLFDSRTGNLYRIFSEAAGQKYNMSSTIFTVLETSQFVPWTMVSSGSDMSSDVDKIPTRGAIKSSISGMVGSAWNNVKSFFWKKTEVSNDTDLTVDEDLLIVRSGVKDVIEDFISSAEVVNDAAVVQNDKITLSATPSGGIIGGVCQVRVDNSGVYDEVTVSVSGTTVALEVSTPGEYDGRVAIVSYLKTL